MTTIATAHEPTTLVTLEDLEAAARSLRGVAVRTPLLSMAVLSAPGAPVSVKPEMLQSTGAFKVRGAYYFLSRLSPEERARGVVAPSAWTISSARDMRCCVVVPASSTRAPSRSAPCRLGLVTVVGMTTVHGTPNSAAAAATACAWLPDEGATTPRARSSGDSRERK